jgi:hypothetical protein
MGDLSAMAFGEGWGLSMPEGLSESWAGCPRHFQSAAQPINRRRQIKAGSAPYRANS